MNNRDYKKFFAGGYYHLYNRGNNKQDIFLQKTDYLGFFNRLFALLKPKVQRASLHFKRACPLPENAFSLICYCLMPNHFHLVLKQNTELGVDKLMSRLCTSYSKHFNYKYERVGKLFQDQYKAVRVDDDSYLLWLSAYIHQNPRVAGMVENLIEYPWSSFPEYMGFGETFISEKDIILTQFQSREEYRKFVEDSYAVLKRKKELEYMLID
jgi:putative transposase